MAKSDNQRIFAWRAFWLRLACFLHCASDRCKRKIKEQKAHACTSRFALAPPSSSLDRTSRGLACAPPHGSMESHLGDQLFKTVQSG